MSKDVLGFSIILGAVVTGAALIGLCNLVAYLHYKVHQKKVEKICAKYPDIMEMLLALQEKKDEYAEVFREMREIEREIDAVCERENYMTPDATKDVLDPLRAKWMVKNMLKVLLNSDIEDRRTKIEAEMAKYPKEVQLCWSWNHMEE